MSERGLDQMREAEQRLSRELAALRARLAAASADAPGDAPSPAFERSVLYRAIVDSAIDYAIIAADLDGRIVEWNEGARRLLGWSAQEIIGRDVALIFTPEDRQEGVHAREMRTAIEQGHALDERWHLRRDGSRFWADGRMMALRSGDGPPHGYLKILRDETPRKTSDHLATLRSDILKTVTDHVDAAILQVDPDNRIVFANPGAERLLGADDGGLTGRRLDDLLASSDAPETDAILTVVRSGAAVRDREARFRKADGTEVPVSIAHAPILADGTVVGAVMAAQDMSGRHRREAALSAEFRRHDDLARLQQTVEAAAGDIDAIMTAVVQGAMTALPQACNAVMQIAEGEHSVFRAVADPAFGPVGTRVPLDRSLAGESLRLGRALVCDDLEADERVDRETGRRLGFRSLVAVPVPRHGGLEGVLVVASTSLAAFSMRDVLVARILAGHVATGFAQSDEARARSDMRRSQERLHHALQASETIGTWDWDADQDRCYADARFARLFSVDPAEAAKGLPIGRFAAGIHPDDLMWVGIAARKALAESGDYAMEHRVLLSDGSVRWLSARGRAEPARPGQPRRLLGAVVDITERKRIETSLRTAETNARLAVEAAGLGLWDFDPAADRVIWDERCRSIFGLAPDLVPSVELVTACVHPRSRDDLRALVQDAIATGRLNDRVRAFEILRHGDREERWVELSAQAFFTDGRCTRIIGTIADVTDRKRLEAALRADEQRFRTMAETIPQLAWMAAPDGRLDWFNERWFDYTGTTLADMQGDGWQAVHDPGTREAVAERLAAALRDGTPWEDTILLRGRDGRFRWFLSRALPMRQEGGTILRWFGTHTDIDDQVRAREAQARFGEDLERQVAARTVELSLTNERLVAEMAERQRAEEALRQSQKMEAVGQLTGGIAHDFNNLLTGITGSLDLMRRRLDQGRTGDLDRYMTAAATSANRAAALTHRLLAFARRQPLDARAVDANALVASMEELFHRTLGETIEIELALSPDLWTTLCDPHQLENALLNLAINARDAMPDGGRLTIRTANREVAPAEIADEPDRRPGSFVSLTVADTGVGIPPDVLARVFEPFFTTKPIGQGTGLGLSMIYGFARQSDGHVAIESTPGSGTAFTLLLPRYLGRDDAVEPLEMAREMVSAQGETVLVVEDDPVVRALVLDVLGELGFATAEAHDGLAGLAILQGRARIDLVVTDVGLPGLNGRQMAEMGLILRPDLKVLFITGYAENAAFGTGALEASMQMITKPFAIDALAAKIRAMLGD